jgi:hypothetical protein
MKAEIPAYSTTMAIPWKQELPSAMNHKYGVYLESDISVKKRTVLSVMEQRF